MQIDQSGETFVEFEQVHTLSEREQVILKKMHASGFKSGGDPYKQYSSRNYDNDKGSRGDRGYDRGGDRGYDRGGDRRSNFLDKKP